MGHLRNFFLERLDRFSEKSSIDSTDIGKALERALKVNRIEVDEEVFFLDGKGRQIQAKCKAIRPFGFEIINFSQEKKSKPNLHLFLAPPQGPAFDEAIVQACEIGVDEITFIKSQHGQNFSERIWKKAENRILEACLQCGRKWMPSLNPEWKRADQLDFINEQQLLVFADENLSSLSGIGLQQDYSMEKLSHLESIHICIGAEGGWAKTERLSFAKHQAVGLSLGRHILRVPTAIVAAVFYMRTLLSQQKINK